MKTKTKIAIAGTLARPILRARALIGRGPCLEATRGGFRWELDLREGIDFSLFLNQYERTTTRFLSRELHPGDIALDLGANIGAQTLPMAQAVGDQGRIIAIEATDFAFAKLRRNLALNPRLEARVTTIQAILGDVHHAKGDAIYSSWPIVGHATPLGRHEVHLGVAKQTGDAVSCKLDELVAKLQLTRVDFIKLDVDGNELTVLRSAEEILARFRPRMVIEFAPYLHRASADGFQALLDFIDRNGYGLFTLDEGVRVELSDAAFDSIVDHGASVDLEARPR